MPRGTWRFSSGSHDITMGCFKGDVMEYMEYTGINITLCNLGVSETRAYHHTGNFIRESMMHKQILGYHMC